VGRYAKLQGSAGHDRTGQSHGELSAHRAFLAPIVQGIGRNAFHRLDAPAGADLGGYLKLLAFLGLKLGYHLGA